MKTPYFLIHEEELEKNVLKLECALKQYWENYIIGYSFKTNALPYLLSYMKNKGIYAEVVSENEFYLAQEVGYERNKIIYNGPVKEKQSFIQAVKEGAIVNIDAHREILWLQELPSSKEYSVGIRVNFDLEKECPGETSSGTQRSRFGFCYESGELKSAIDELLKLENVKISGLHLHNSTKTRSLNVYEKISRMACKIAEEFFLDLSYIDIGGGFFGGLENVPQFNEYIRTISLELQKTFLKGKTTLIVEPGTSIISSPVDFVTSVVDIKKAITNRFVVTDGSRINIDPLMRKSGYFLEIKYGNSVKRQCVDKQVICGFTCMENDRLLSLENEKELQEGDTIIYRKTGAYTMCLNPLFIQYFPAVYWKKKTEFFCVRKSWTEENYMQNAIWEDEQIEYIDLELWNKE